MRTPINCGRGLRVIALIAALGLVLAVSAQAARVQIPEGAKLSVKFPASIKISSGELGEGIPILFELASPFEIGGKVIVAKGAQGTAVVKESVKSGRGGKPGKITVEFVELMPSEGFQAADGSPIKLKGAVTAEGKGRKLLSYLFIFGLFIKGGQGEIPGDQVYTATVAESIILEEK
ncbi:MAG: hypothetical protein JSW34_07095 [Candidatus Zixiibacteriota bacterium]|nr:MAG: hypothetical protein JSW34_07095 [candidate division Zixibacteria bacterium]